MRASPLVENMASAVAGSLVGNPARARAERLGQGDAARFFRSIGADVERQCGKGAGVAAMDCLATVMALAEMAAPAGDERLDDLACFLAERIRHNADRLFPLPLSTAA